MGAAMAKRLAAGGHNVVVWNRTRAAADAVGDAARVAGTPSDAVKGAEFVIAMLSSGEVTESVLLAEDVVAALRDEAIVCDMGTSGVATAHALHDALDAAGHAFVDAPVSGSVPTVEAGQLLVMAGGSAESVAAVTPVWTAFAKQVIHLGGTGTGQAMKLAVNLVVYDLNSAISEALVLATRAGIASGTAYDVFQNSVVAAPFVNYKRDAFLTDDAPVAMSLELVAKDLRLITALADSVQAAVPGTRAVHAAVDAACQAGHNGEDLAALFRYLAGERSSAS
jgi:3-hydroxyisobutyrate dehydrogenase-like beta-hydroxyacid dehydrogenase